ncbi:rhomboid family intramembrane serine protease [Myroides sp. DF42-4-2]|uniref:rhomboid family intramembrane serine protease n=1 Tax=unclassified Myroides TaxID=2642485 RepID=UPI0025791C96|nr:rhomboid family intramembrane serine protease [Myroides sp. DF42-4-2]MDM1407672.1 rhomboid family intramembrane serine protease [Myroides sp. DF42-4-2]
MKEKQLVITADLIILPVLFLMLIWTVYWLDWKDYLQLYQYGVYPRTLKGLRGIIFSPFIHGGLKHIYNNSVALFVLLLLVQFFYKKQVWQILGWGILLSGLGTWLIARESYHIGASGLIYVLVSYMFFKGIQTKYFRLVALSLLIVMLYGSMIWYVFPDIEEGISWEGHLSGFITGMLLSFVLKSPVYAEKVYKYEWQSPDYNESNDPFMQCFDAEGNFVIVPKEVRQAEALKNPYRKTLPILYKRSDIKENGDSSTYFASEN